MKNTIPPPFFICASAWCEAEGAVPASYIHWSKKENQWYCDGCFEMYQGGLGEKGISLEEYASHEIDSLRKKLNP